ARTVRAHLRRPLFPAPPPTDIYTLSLHDALPICNSQSPSTSPGPKISTSSSPLCLGKRASQRPLIMRKIASHGSPSRKMTVPLGDRKSTRLNSSHVSISYAVFCLKKKIPQPLRTD